MLKKKDISSPFINGNASWNCGCSKPSTGEKKQ